MYRRGNRSSQCQSVACLLAGCSCAAVAEDMVDDDDDEKDDATYVFERILAVCVVHACRDRVGAGPPAGRGIGRLEFAGEEAGEVAFDKFRSGVGREEVRCWETVPVLAEADGDELGWGGLVWWVVRVQGVVDVQGCHVG